jgi:lipopolysaccharide biosynthesis protein
VRINTKGKRIAVLYHVFYENSVDEICIELKPFLLYDVVFLFNICDITPGKDKIASILANKFPGCYIINSSNKGKDIGAKLCLLALYKQMQFKCEYIVFLHDKKSLQALKEIRWKKELLKILAPENIDAILNHFSNHNNSGIAATKTYILKEVLDHKIENSVNSGLIKELLNQYKIAPINLEYIAGTMFWARAKPFEDFFLNHDPLLIREKLESGNVLDNFEATYTHSWERILTWIVTEKNYKIYGI